jgi:serine/threonine-protein kinase RsbW
MDWCVDTRVRDALDRTATEMAAHLGRHAIEPGVVELARPVLHEALAAFRSGPLWASLDWSRRQCVLRLRPIEELVGTPVGPGVTRAHEEATQLGDYWRGGQDPGAEVVVPLGVARPPEQDIDPVPASAETLRAADPAHLLGLVAGEIESGHSLEEAAAKAGASVAALVEGDATGTPPGLNGMVEGLIRAEERLGGSFEVVETGNHRVVLRNGRCPFGPATSPGMCRFTSALAGSLGARRSGSSSVTVLESLAAGDHECRLIVDDEDGLDPTVAHRYQWPPKGRNGPLPDPGASRRGFQVTLSLQLPRDKLSVPITRHLIRAAMQEVGVVSDDGDAVELAVTEACANVIDHSGPGDAYDVAVSISPSACHIRVVDVGRGFDHEALSLSRMADQHAEHGRGVALMHALVDQVRFESEPERGTVVHLVKLLTFEDSAPAHKLMASDPRLEGT